MKRWICFLLAGALCLIMLAGCGCSHEWLAADCTAPKTCSLCKETEGDALGHAWQAAACEVPKTCSRCAVTEGSPLGHSWQDATCQAPKSCTLCGAEDGESLSHEPGTPVYSSVDFTAATATGTVSCALCGAVLESGELSLTSLHDGSRFLCEPLEFFNRFAKIVTGNTPLAPMMTTDSADVYVAQSYTADGYGLPLYVSRYVFYNGHTPVTSRDAEQRFSAITVYLGLNGTPMTAMDSIQLPATLWAIFTACDPALTQDDILAAVDALFRDDIYTANGITYKLFFSEDSVLTLTIQVGQ